MSSSSILPYTVLPPDVSDVKLEPVDQLLEETLRGVTCCICLKLPWDPIVTPCQHMYCRHCIETSLNETATCPKDSKSLSHAQLTDLKVASSLTYGIVSSMRVSCPFFRSAGCDWTGEVSAADGHVRNYCPFVLVECGACKVRVRRSQIRQHLDSECPYRAAVCTYCSASIAVRDMEEHEKTTCPDCPTTIVACSVMGCTVRMARQDRASHYADPDNRHLEMLSQCVATLVEQSKVGVD
jgi:hypothetical protein